MASSTKDPPPAKSPASLHSNGWSFDHFALQAFTLASGPPENNRRCNEDRRISSDADSDQDGEREIVKNRASKEEEGCHREQGATAGQ